MSSPQLLSNRYEIGDTLGYGGMSEVHRGRDIRLGRDVAVKVLRADLARDPTFQLRFRREAQNAAALNHPAIVAVYDTGETDSDNGPLPYIVMEYVDGRTLRDIVKTEGPLAPRRAMEVMADASAALDFSHRHGIVHRDVKPANVMITKSGAVKVMDFGIARALADGQAAVTQTAAVIGTAQYLSPEQARGESVDARSDVYASGCVLFELLTGEPPFTGDSPVAVAYQHVREDPRKPSEVNAQVPASLDAVVLKALSKNPANRYQSAAEMRADLVRVLSGQRPKAPMIMSEEERTSMMAAPPPSPTDVIAPRRHRQADAEDVSDEENERRRRKRWKVTLITVLCVAALALVAWVANFLFSNSASDPKFAMGNYRDMPISIASDKARNEGWQLDNLGFCPSPRDKKDLVVDQRPSPGTPTGRQDKLWLCKGTGPQPVAVPNLMGQSVPDAQRFLAQLNLQLGTSDSTTPVDRPELIGKIVAWTPNSGFVDAGTPINVTIGAEIKQIPVPPVRGMPYAQAEALLKANFTVKRQTAPSDQPAETVIDQDPPANSKARPGSTVTLMVSDGQQISMPPLTGMSKSEAEQTLRAAGWVGTSVSVVKQPTTDPTMNNRVVGSNPSAGSTISRNQPITLYFGDYSSSPSSSATTSPPTGGLTPPFSW
jgi:eukaryotic-like serine/threonine-protein kinase